MPCRICIPKPAPPKAKNDGLPSLDLSKGQAFPAAGSGPGASGVLSSLFSVGRVTPPVVGQRAFQIPDSIPYIPLLVLFRSPPRLPPLLSVRRPQSIVCASIELSPLALVRPSSHL